MSWNVISAFVLDQILGYQTMNKVRDNLVALVSRRSGRSLGGTRVATMPLQPSWDAETESFRSKFASVGPHDVDNFIDVEIDGTNQTGITYQARVEVRSSTSGIVSITPKVRNVTDSTDAGTGSASSAGNVDYSGTNQKQTIALTIASGVKKYRLQFTLSVLALWNDVWCVGEIESFATA